MKIEVQFNPPPKFKPTLKQFVDLVNSRAKVGLLEYYSDEGVIKIGANSSFQFSRMLSVLILLLNKLGSEKICVWFYDGASTGNRRVYFNDESILSAAYELIESTYSNWNDLTVIFKNP